jgi:hypothetical protein
LSGFVVTDTANTLPLSDADAGVPVRRVPADLEADSRGPWTVQPSFPRTEADNGDTTYFLLQQLTVIERAIAAFDRCVERKTAEH